MPWDSRIRMQYIMSLERLRASDKVKVLPQAADLIYRIAKTASPMHQAVMVSRATYLLNTGRWKGNSEITELVNALRAKAKMYPETWMVLAYYNGRIGDQAAAAQSLVRGLQIGGDIKTFRNIARSINMEIEEK